MYKWALYFVVEAVDGYIAEELKKLEVKYPIISRPPNEVSQTHNAILTSHFVRYMHMNIVIV